MGCFYWILLLAGAVLVMMTLLRWFEQITDAVDQRWWNKVIVLVLMPFTVWFFASRVSAGRPSPVPRHEPVRGFGSLPKGGIHDPVPAGPPPGTPKEFIGLPKVPPKAPVKKPPPDADKIARLRQKMREQGMLDDDAE